MKNQGFRADIFKNTRTATELVFERPDLTEGVIVHSASGPAILAIGFCNRRRFCGVNLPVCTMVQSRRHKECWRFYAWERQRSGFWMLLTDADTVLPVVKGTGRNRWLLAKIVAFASGNKDEFILFIGLRHSFKNRKRGLIRIVIGRISDLLKILLGYFTFSWKKDLHVVAGDLSGTNDIAGSTRMVAWVDRGA